jgi:hypothetical protein
MGWVSRAWPVSTDEHGRGGSGPCPRYERDTADLVAWFCLAGFPWAAGGMGVTVVANVLQKDGAHGAPYEKTTGYACSRVGCAVRTKGFCRPGRGILPRRSQMGRDEDGRERDGQGPAKGPTHPGVGCVGAKKFSPLQRRALWARMYTARQGTETRSFLSCSAEKGHDMERTGWSPCRAGRGGAGTRPHLRCQ